MALQFRKPILYLITRGASKPSTTSKAPEFQAILTQISAAVAAGIDLIQVREKHLSARVLFELCEQAVRLTSGSATRLVVNDRADIAAGAGADGVHLTTRSIDARTIRKTFGEELLIGASTHSIEEAVAARDGDADFIVFGPIFETPSKLEYGPAVGIEQLSKVANELESFPVVALGGVTLTNARNCLNAGASGIAGISIFGNDEALASVIHAIKEGSEDEK
jgi:thiamine-phosphate pyrophosphorylase